MSCKIGPLCQFARRLRPYLLGIGILAHARWPLGTNVVEAINTLIMVIKRIAYASAMTASNDAASVGMLPFPSIKV
ncbi:hypothetical protein [Cupriavidus basilensis]|uniref:hypothetical protein n=1 Tax=Cupriavidus basilensis TaxID=68895 RepID=UPI003D3461B6